MIHTKQSSRIIPFHRFRQTTLLAALITTGGIVSKGLADNVEPIILDEVTVLGELLPRQHQSSATSAVIVLPETIEDRGDVDLYDVVRRIPNASVTNGEQGFSIRGIDQRGIGGGGSGRTISIQVDGAALPGVQSTF